MRFTLLTAWRDARTRRRRLFGCAAAIICGVAALVAIHSLGDDLREATDAKAQTLLGADLQLTARIPFGEETERFIVRAGGDVSRETRFASMALFPKSGDTRLVQVRAVAGGFPYYGELKTRPEGLSVAGAEEPVALLDPLLFALFDLHPGDTIRLGRQDFRILGEIVESPGESPFAGLFAPRVMIPRRFLDATELVGQGTIAFHRVSLLLPPGTDPDALARSAQKAFDRERVEWDTVVTRKEELGRSLENLYRFFNLVGVIALLLGGVGVAGAVQAYLRDKRDTVAVLRCLGCSVGAACRVFLWQVAAATFLGALIGAALGVWAQSWLPVAVGPLLPFTLETHFRPIRVAEALAFGWLVAGGFALLPLAPLRRISPLRALRADFQPPDRFDPMVWGLRGALALAVTLFCVRQTVNPWHGLAFAGGLGLALLAFVAVAALLRALLRRLAGRIPSYVVRQGLANLHRPNNRTLFLVATLGLGAFLIETLFLVEGGLRQDAGTVNDPDEPNALFYDIQPDQREGFERIVREHGLVILDGAPIVTMRLEAVKGRSVSALKADPESRIDAWILNREWRSTWRAEPSETETVVAGDFVGQWDGWDEPVPISLEDDMAEDLGVGLGDVLTFNVQGVPLDCRIASLRRVDWKRMRPNFFAVFPEGVLERAPGWHLAFVRTDGPAQLAGLQRAVVTAYPNIAAVDLGVILSGLRDILGRVTFALRFMALFTVLTGVIVLVGAVVTSRYQRFRECVLLRTLGARGGQVRAILMVEYASVGLLAGLVGSLLAWAAAFSLGTWVFETPVPVPWTATALTVLATTLLTLCTGLMNSRGLVAAPPLAVLREAAG